MEGALYIYIFFLCHASRANALKLSKALMKILGNEPVNMENVNYYLNEMHCS